MAYEVDRLEIVIQTATSKTNAALDKLIVKLNKISANLKQMQTFVNTVNGKQPTSTTKSDTMGIKKNTAEVKNLNKNLNVTRARVTSIRSIFIKITSLLYALRFLGKSIKTAMDFGETINLFQTVFRKIGLDAGKEFEMAFLERADKFVQDFSQALTLDPDELMKYMANFAQMANSMSVTTESAYMLSQSLTMLGADISSLFNIDIDDAMSKLKSGLAGQIRPMRQLGVDISKTSLQQIALRYGIEDSIETMSAAAKVQLRYLALMDQLKVTMGDMARTINSPANQLRVLQQQWVNLTRAIGQVFIPLVSKLLPILNAIVIALREMISAMAAFVGYEMPDFTDTDIFLGDISDEADEADESLQQLRNTLGGFDELNIIGMQTEGDDLLGSGYAQLDDAIFNTYNDYMDQMNEQLAAMSNTAKELSGSFKIILTLLTTYLTTLAAIKVATIAVTAATSGWAVSAALIGNKSLFAVAISSITTLIVLWEDLSTPMKVILGAIGAITTALLVVRNTLVIVKAATIAWNLVLALNPILLIVMAIITAIAVAAYLIIKYWDEVVAGVTAAFEFVRNVVLVSFAFVQAKVMGVVDFIVLAFNNVKNFFVGMWDGLTLGLVAAWDFMKNMFGKIGDFFGSIGEGIGDVFKDLLNTLIKGLNWIIRQPFEAVNDVLEAIKSVSIAGVKPFDFVQTIEIPQIPKLATGGIVDYGQLFVAREAGAELVGNFGGTTGVMNNEQIVEAVSDGVYRAVMAAQSGNGKEFNVTVMLDGKQISSSVEQNRRRKGASILSGGNV